MSLLIYEVNLQLVLKRHVLNSSSIQIVRLQTYTIFNDHNFLWFNSSKSQISNLRHNHEYGCFE